MLALAFGIVVMALMATLPSQTKQPLSARQLSCDLSCTPFVAMSPAASAPVVRRTTPLA